VDRLVEMFEAQLAFQDKVNASPTSMPESARAQWIAHMITACIAELVEALDEVGWKSWATTRHVNETAAFGELRDAWQFLTNAMFTVRQVSAEQLAKELEEALYAKLQINHARHESGYDSTTTKCPSCKRALDEVTLTVIHMPNDVEIDKVLCVCGAQLTVDMVGPYLND
jgi:heterodisulfide reductase subunit B